MNISRRSKEACQLYLATLGPLGWIPFAPGTWGSLAAVLIAPWLFLPLHPLLQVFLVLLLFVAGSWAASQAEKTLQQKDPGPVIIDEFAGQLLVFIFILQPGFWQLGVGFLLFRLFDISKPWPVGASESWLASGYGVMLDDILAGIYAGLSLLLLQALIIVIL